MRHAFLSRSAESMIETIVAITVLVIGTAASLTLLRSSLMGNELVGMRVVATQLAEEGLEALKNIRDTNYLRSPDYASSCWKTYGATAADCSDGTVLSTGTTYYFVRSVLSTDFLDWQLVPVTSSSQGYLSLYTVDLGDGRSMNLYAQSGLTTSGFALVEARVFRRTMTLSYNSTGTSYDATVTVTWQDRSTTHSVTRKGRIANVY